MSSLTVLGGAVRRPGLRVSPEARRLDACETGEDRLSDSTLWGVAVFGFAGTSLLGCCTTSASRPVCGIWPVGSCLTRVAAAHGTKRDARCEHDDVCSAGFNGTKRGHQYPLDDGGAVASDALASSVNPLLPDEADALHCLSVVILGLDSAAARYVSRGRQHAER